MSDTEVKECKIATPEKKVVEEEKEEVTKDTPTKESPVKKVVEEVDDSSENGKAEHVTDDSSENGKSEESEKNGVAEKDSADEKDVSEASNGDSTDAPVENVCVKRKSTGADVTEEAAKEVTSPKKAKLEEKPAAVEAEANGGGA